MARSNSRKKRRDTIDIANSELPLFGYTPRPYSPIKLRTIEDRRLFHPEKPHEPARTIKGTVSRIRSLSINQTRRSQTRAAQSNRFQVLPSKPIFVFSEPSETIVCARRSIRREVLHALKKTGRGGQRKPRFNLNSKIKCKK